MSDWNSAQYLKFEKERTQPAADLLSRVSDFSPEKILDAGCGPGNSTALLAKRFGTEKVLGVDASDDMLKKAREKHPEIRFEKAFLPDGISEFGKFDLIFSNACIHWIPDHQKLIPSLFSHLSEGGRLAVQIPYKRKSVFYGLLFSLLDTKWAKLKKVRLFNELTPEEYYDILSSLSADFSIWETEYYHTVNSFDDIIGWYSGSGLRPYYDVLSPAEKEEFVSDLKKLISENFKIQQNGKIILKMPRLFFTVTKG